MYLNYCQKIQKFVLESIFPFFAKMGQGKNSSNFRIVFLKAGERSVDCKYSPKFGFYSSLHGLLRLTASRCSFPTLSLQVYTAGKRPTSSSPPFKALTLRVDGRLSLFP
ncbi:unnamed protein product [Rangifer tarandus platyrhynchus]|uniref:Uncharacterized protein n=1 Tax=Rangifer tarandus platyrhynchus TaxID=3082113 RepID=A0ABN8Y586_RANTA|nr:unnamed protein product [Rangifer tarandus platyrhynchus]